MIVDDGSEITKNLKDLCDTDKTLVIVDDSETKMKTLRDSLLTASSLPINESLVTPTSFLPNKSQTNAALAILGGMWGGVIPVPKKKTEKPLQKCGLKECNVLTIKDFCCAEHYRVAKAKHKT